MLMRNTNTGVFEVYDVSNNQINVGGSRWGKSVSNGR